MPRAWCVPLVLAWCMLFVGDLYAHADFYTPVGLLLLPRNKRKSLGEANRQICEEAKCGRRRQRPEAGQRGRG